MKIFGKYHMVRPYWVHTQRLGLPILIERRTGRMRPYVARGSERDEWNLRREQIEADRRHARLVGCGRRLAALFDSDALMPLWMLGDAALAATTLGLDSNYVAGSSGDAIGARFQAHRNRTLNTVYYYISSFTGTAANVNDINLELRPESAAGASTPDTGTLTDSKTHNPSSTTGWHAVSGWTTALTAPNRYWVVIGDADGNGTDFATILSRTSWLNYPPGAGNVTGSRFLAASTTGGWASSNTASTITVSNLVFGFADSTVFGNPLTTQTAPASDTNRRGLRLTANALVASLEIFGFLWTANSANISGGEFWTGNTGPNGTADNVSTDLLYGAASSRMGVMPTGGGSYTLSAGTAYSLVATFSGATNAGPQRADIGTGEDATLRTAMPGGGEIHYRRANGTSDWSNDLVGSIGNVALLVDGQVAAAGGDGAVIASLMGGIHQ